MGLSPEEFEKVWKMMIEVHGSTHNSKKSGYAYRLKDYDYDPLEKVINMLIETTPHFPKIPQIKNAYLDQVRSMQRSTPKETKHYECDLCLGSGQIPYWRYKGMANCAPRAYKFNCHCFCEAGKESIAEHGDLLPLYDQVLTAQRNLPKYAIQFETDDCFNGRPHELPIVSRGHVRNE